MNKYEEWLEEYKHLTGEHNQKKHGNRGTRVSQEAISGLSKDAQTFYSKLDTKSQVKFRLAWYRETKKNPNANPDDFVKKFAPTPTPIQSPASVPATPVKAAVSAPAPAPKFTSVLDVQNWEKTLTRAEAIDFQKQWRKKESANVYLHPSAQTNRIQFANEYASQPHKNLPELPVSFDYLVDRHAYEEKGARGVRSVPDGNYRPTKTVEIFIQNSPSSSYGHTRDVATKNDIIENLPGGFFLLRGGKQPRIKIRFTEPPGYNAPFDNAHWYAPVGYMDYLG